ncbi:hypothetical protein [Iodobacter sp.]|uniref:hypothetical protein n=1 Tax=Iodobacter sp. TaxID=1915058 RepID=UPI0025E6831E|nr:hypothetical protein [Iodobacter sp.]
MANAREMVTSLRALAIARLVICLLLDLVAVFVVFNVLVALADLFFAEALALALWLEVLEIDDFVADLWPVFAAAVAGTTRPSAATSVQHEKMRYSMR